jgi:hypothetical protein
VTATIVATAMTADLVGTGDHAATIGKHVRMIVEAA